MQLPEKFTDETRRTLGDELFERYRLSFGEPAPVSIRTNGEGVVPQGGEPVAWCAGGYYLSDRPAFTFDPLLHAGRYYVQEASSMFLDHVLRHVLLQLTASAEAGHGGLRALDLCAAPGGKSTLLASRLPQGSLLVSNEPNAKRAQVLSENLQKWQLQADAEGIGTPVVSCNYPRDFRRSKLEFDVILCDVPCSGEGMFRKDAAAIGEWSPENVAKCWPLQREIVADAWACLSAGGYLVYSTCTLNLKENEENVRSFVSQLGAEVVEIPIRREWNIVGSLLPGFDAPVYRFIPGIARGEGLFMAVLKKAGQRAARPTRPPRRNLPLNLLPNSFLEPLREARQAGCPQVDVDYGQAIGYLRREALTLPPDTPRGLVVIAYEGHPLGLAKNIGSRANNLYPKEWRIKSTHLPDMPPAVVTSPPAGG